MWHRTLSVKEQQDIDEEQAKQLEIEAAWEEHDNGNTELAGMYRQSAQTLRGRAHNLYQVDVSAGEWIEVGGA